jgi:adenylate kinase family enzyme
MKKITICGVPASGKSTLANKLGIALNIPVFHLDKIFWKDNGIFASQAEGIEKVEEILKEPSWILEGSMPRSKTFDMRINEADTIILFDIPLWLTLWRQTKRFFKYYGKTRPDMGGNNKQKYPFTLKEIRYALAYPTKDMYEKILPLQKTKKVFIIKNKKDEKRVLRELVQ